MLKNFIQLLLRKIITILWFDMNRIIVLYARQGIWPRTEFHANIVRVYAFFFSTATVSSSSIYVRSFQALRCALLSIRCAHAKTGFHTCTVLLDPSFCMRALCIIVTVYGWNVYLVEKGTNIYFCNVYHRYTG